MNYEYTVLSENNYGVLKQELNDFGRNGWKLVNVDWDNDNACLVAVMMRERKEQKKLIIQHSLCIFECIDHIFLY